MHGTGPIGVGGLFTGESSILGDYPGAALLYAVTAVVLFPRRPPRQEAAAAGRGRVPMCATASSWI